MTTTTYDVETDRTTVWIWQRAPRQMRDEGVESYWKALFWFHGHAAMRER